MITSRVRALTFAVLLLTCLGASTAEAQSRYDWRRNWERTSEGEVGEEVEREVSSRRGISSSVQRKINNLDDDPVEDLPIPILFGIAVNQLTKNFGDPRDGGSRSHEGLDILAPLDAYIVSPTEAVVIRTGKGSSAGTYVYTANPGDETFVYMHLDKIADGIKAGVELQPGDLIGYVGNTGNASGGPTHLHFEIREGRKAHDPYPRLNEEFSLKDRMEAVEKIIEDADDADEEAENLVSLYRGIFIAARAQDNDLPEEIEDALEDAGVPTSGPVVFTRDLTLGSQGQDVVALQTLLVAENTGVKARALADAGATGYFGVLTQAALTEYQAAGGITPSTGYFGPLTRAHIAVGN